MKKLILQLPFLIIITLQINAQSADDCLICHDDPGFKGEVNGRTVSIYVSEKVFTKSVHGNLDCVDCHSDIDIDEMPHRAEFTRVQCGDCHDDVLELYKECLHGKANARGDKLAPICQDCHGKHDILSVKDHNSNVSPMKIPYLCGRCHKEGTPVQLQRHIPQDRILENYSESIHGEGLLKKGLVVAATCVSCHSSHRILPHTDPRSTISRQNIANTCAVCHAEIETVHRKVIRGELWEKQEREAA